MSNSPKALSIVVACNDADAAIATCLSSIQAQAEDGVAEIIVVDNSRDGATRIIDNDFGDVQVVTAPESLLVPQLWAQGAKLASGEVVAFTTAHFFPDEHWVREILRHHRSEYAAVGGAIENAEPSAPTQWAVYFCRYANYMLPFGPALVRQVPGDNASYKRWVLEEYAGLIEDGFWETTVNDQLSKDGHTLLMTPRVRVDHGPSFGLWAFCRQRLTHGRVFGAERAAATSSGRRLLYLAASPMIPIVFLGKIARAVFRKRRHRRAFLVSLPALSLFVLCWSFGEILGFVGETLRRRGRTSAIRTLKRS